MKSFFGGQIKEEHRGSLAAIVTSERGRDHYIISACHPLSEEFVRLSGVGQVAHPIERLYLGVSKEAVEKVREIHGLTRNEERLNALDEILVIPIFRDQSIVERSKY